MQNYPFTNCKILYAQIVDYKPAFGLIFPEYTETLSGMRELPELPFENYRSSVGTDYDQVIDILDNVRHDTDKLKEIWAILARVFWRSEDITKEEIEKMMQVADC